LLLTFPHRAKACRASGQVHHTQHVLDGEQHSEEKHTGDRGENVKALVRLQPNIDDKDEKTQTAMMHQAQGPRPPHHPRTGAALSLPPAPSSKTSTGAGPQNIPYENLVKFRLDASKMRQTGNDNKNCHCKGTIDFT